MIINNDDHALMEDIINYTLTKSKDVAIELVIRPECNQKCKYCYLVQHGKETYPTRASNEQILNNTNKLIDYFIEKDYLIKRFDLFAGDLFYDDLFFDLIPIFYRYYSWVNENHYDFIQHHHRYPDKIVDPAIVVPCNMSFCENDEKIAKVKECQKILHDLGVALYFSYSTDGKYATDSREQKTVPDEFFHKVFKFCEEMNWGVHPIISYENIDSAINNYNWFKEIFKQYRLNDGSDLPYFLEARNDGWTSETIEKYQKFLYYILDDIFHEGANSNAELFFDCFLRIFQKDSQNKYKFVEREAMLYNLLALNIENIVPCGIGLINLYIYMGDLSIIPCHRTAYPELRGGNFKIKNDKIVGITAAEGYNAYLHASHFHGAYRPGCVTCDYNDFCLKNCLGASYEKFGDINIPVPSVCQLLQAKINTIVEYYHDVGIFHWLFQTEPEYPCNTSFKKLLLKLGYLEYEKYTDLGELRKDDYSS